LILPLNNLVTSNCRGSGCCG